MLMSGYFIVRQINESFNAVSTDIQRSQKIVGQTRKSKYVTEWEVPCHEILSINSAINFAPLLLQILDHLSHTSIMNCLETIQKITIATYTKYIHF